MICAAHATPTSAKRLMALLTFDTGLSADRLAQMRFVRLDEVGGDLRLLPPDADERDWQEYGLSPETVEALGTALSDRSWRQIVEAALA